MIKKSKKLMTSLLLALSLTAVLPATNAFADEYSKTISSEENAEYIKFIKEECTPTETKHLFYNEKDGKYYGTRLSNQYGLTKAKNAYTGGDGYASEDGSLVKNKWVLVKTPQGTTHWEYYGSDYKRKTGFQTIDGKVYNLGDGGWLKEGWWQDKDDHYSWHYTYPDSSVKEGWLNDGGNWYYIYSDGKMAKDTTINGYYVNSKGIWS